MPRPYVDRVARSVRLPAGLDAQLVATAKKRGTSVNVALEDAVRTWLNEPRPTPPLEVIPVRGTKPTRREVTPRFKGKP